MKRKKISETIENINPKYIDEATKYTGAVKSNSKKVWYKWVAAVACLCLIVTAVIAHPSIIKKDNGLNG